jgi:O-antigen ligase
MSFLKSFSSETGVYHKNNDPRVTIWKSTFKLIVKNPVLGVGIGDARNELTGEYKRAGEEALQASRFNAHNQFLEIALESGIIGLIMFLGICGWMIYLAFLYKNLLLGLFMFMMSIFFMFETILYRLAGVEFFALFSFLLLHIESMSGKAVIE